MLFFSLLAALAPAWAATAGDPCARAVLPEGTLDQIAVLRSAAEDPAASESQRMERLGELEAMLGALRAQGISVRPLLPAPRVGEVDTIPAPPTAVDVHGMREIQEALEAEDLIRESLRSQSGINGVMPAKYWNYRYLIHTVLVRHQIHTDTAKAQIRLLLRHMEFGKRPEFFSDRGVQLTRISTDGLAPDNRPTEDFLSVALHGAALLSDEDPELFELLSSIVADGTLPLAAAPLNTLAHQLVSANMFPQFEMVARTMGLMVSGELLLREFNDGHRIVDQIPRLRHLLPYYTPGQPSASLVDINTPISADSTILNLLVGRLTDPTLRADRMADTLAFIEEVLASPGVRVIGKRFLTGSLRLDLDTALASLPMEVESTDAVRRIKVRIAALEAASP